jgi:hypothetical protein
MGPDLITNYGLRITNTGANLHVNCDLCKMTLHPASGIRHPESIRNIIFDFGGVLCDLDIDLTKKKFTEFGPPRDGAAIPPEEAGKAFNLLVEHLETGRIAPAEFREAIRDHYLKPYPTRPSTMHGMRSWVTFPNTGYACWRRSAATTASSSSATPTRYITTVT